MKVNVGLLIATSWGFFNIVSSSSVKSISSTLPTRNYPPELSLAHRTSHSTHSPIETPHSHSSTTSNGAPGDLLNPVSSNQRTLAKSLSKRADQDVYSEILEIIALTNTYSTDADADADADASDPTDRWHQAWREHMRVVTEYKAMGLMVQPPSALEERGKNLRTLIEDEQRNDIAEITQNNGQLGEIPRPEFRPDNHEIEVSAEIGQGTYCERIKSMFLATRLATMSTDYHVFSIRDLELGNSESSNPIFTATVSVTDRTIIIPDMPPGGFATNSDRMRTADKICLAWDYVTQFNAHGPRIILLERIINPATIGALLTVWRLRGAELINTDRSPFKLYIPKHSPKKDDEIAFNMITGAEEIGYILSMLSIYRRKFGYATIEGVSISTDERMQSWALLIHIGKNQAR
ncbi:hypothetical protein ABW19_dt0204492 [Dactylella cylindrospora]|nr:hypothetical protein ABW19_dt0204492 [Dactylella cylindrospora]